MLRKALLLSTLPLFFSAPAWAEIVNTDDLKDWDLQFNNTARYDHYTVDGNRANSPFPDEGSQWYDEFDSSAARQFNPFEKMHAQFSGVVNGSRYRSRDYDFAPERVNMFYENGMSAVPYRVEAGDYFANLSYRTEQQSLKGAQIELQPESSLFTDQSVMFFSGVSNPSWDRIGDAVDNSTGASWVEQSGDMGRLGFNAVYNYRNGAPPMGGGVVLNKAQQAVESVAWNKDIKWGSERLDLEGELAHMNGDTNASPASKDQSGEGYYVQFNGRSTEAKPLSYRFRFEDNGRDFRPAHAQITPDRQSVEGQVGWRFDNGMNLRGRAHHYADGYHTNTNVQDTGLFGANLQGPLLGSFAPDVSGRVDIYRQDVMDQLNTVNFVLHSASVDASKPINEIWSINGNVVYQNRNDKTVTNRDYDMFQWGGGASYSFNVDEWSGSVTPGLVFRDYSGTIDRQFDVAPSFTMHVAKANQSLDFGYNLLNQDRWVSGQPDEQVQNVNLDYRYQMDEHEFGISGAVYDRAASVGTGTNATRIGAYWTYHFFKPAGSTTNVAKAEHTNLQDSGSALSYENDVSLLAALSTGLSKADAKERVAKAGISGGVTTANAVVYESNLLPSIELRQRLVLGLKQAKLDRASLLLDVEDMSNLPQMQEHYARIRDALIAQLGKPEKEYDSGVDPVGGTEQGSILRRVSEWSTPSGHLRFGLAKGIDGVVRFEVQHAHGLAGASSAFWGVRL